MAHPERDFAGRIVGVALVLRLLAIMIALIGLVGQLITGPLLACVLVLSATTFAMLTYQRTMDFAMRHPLVLVIDVLINLAVVWALGVESPLVLATFPVALIVGVIVERRVAIGAAAVLCAGYYLVAISSPVQPEARGFMSDLGVPLLYVSLLAIGVSVRSAHRQQVEAVHALGVAQRDAAAADERARLAREMHDSVGKSLHGLALGAQGLVAWIDRDVAVARQQAQALAVGAEQAAREARELLVRMRRDEPDRALAEVLADLCGAWQAQTGVRCTFTAHEAVDLPTSVRYEVLAIVGEALENVVRHARASRVAVTLERVGEAVRAGVRDDGVGFVPGPPGEGPAGHFGLVGMYERAEMVGALLRVDSAPGDGTSVTVTWSPVGDARASRPRERSTVTGGAQ
ncbi:sensor histidine kinase [Cellulomonas wangsupingiae]|uniref:histidine kinase n=1 Tax=Cellulomonas wangsupingiae TaxID=2968085 RepID=A0ABY5K269_9CELL|nr:histidine kinase [Cellulomonas wangsupingiae]MCC2335885.1 histidine kinase [Cellulomonas wangsupingiae]MCM0639826.1 histidine kinase [Cellulomonas wangsupingiae]UUI64110.1 histidine kinase [Cellulomonas wangsupingiae]